MNRKLIFWLILWWLALILVIFLMIAKSNNQKKVVYKADWKFHIWTVWDSKTKFDEFISDFKLDNKSMSNVEFDVKSFSNYEDYMLALNSAFIKWQAPDIFVLNNNETSLYEDKVYALSNLKIDIHKFRQDYKSIFINDLIISTWKWENKKEFLKWIPVWYETLGVLYNARYRFKRSDFVSISSMKSAILKVKNFDIIPIWIWNGSTVLNAGDLLAQQFLLNKVDSIKNMDESKIKQTLAEYAAYWDVNWDNWYNSLFTESKSAWKNNIDLFVDKEIWAIIAYPRIIKKLQSYWFSPRFLYAAAYPHSFSWDGPSLANYNYFVINNDSQQKAIALSFMKYINSDKWAKKFLTKFSYYLPAKRTLEDELWKRKISNYFSNIELRDFYSDEPLSSFDKWNKVIYDRNIIPVLDNFYSYVNAFDSFRNSLLCKTEKILELKNLWKSCD